MPGIVPPDGSTSHSIMPNLPRNVLHKSGTSGRLNGMSGMRRQRDPITRLDRKLANQLLHFHGMSQMDLAEKVDVHTTIVSKYLSGLRPCPYPVAVRIAEALGVQVWSLCDGPLCPKCEQPVGEMPDSEEETAEGAQA